MNFEHTTEHEECSVCVRRHSCNSFLAQYWEDLIEVLVTDAYAAYGTCVKFDPLICEHKEVNLRLGARLTNNIIVFWAKHFLLGVFEHCRARLQAKIFVFWQSTFCLASLSTAGHVFRRRSHISPTT